MNTINVWVAMPVDEIEDAKSLRDSRKDGSVLDGGAAKLSQFRDKEKKVLEEAIEYEPLVRKKVTLNSKKHSLQSIYVDSEDSIVELEKAGAIILGAWDWEGNKLREVSKDLKKYMPPRVDEEGNEIEDDSLRDIILIYGQKGRNFE